jgi:hypothetical protein
MSIVNTQRNNPKDAGQHMLHSVKYAGDDMTHILRKGQYAK